MRSLTGVAVLSLLPLAYCNDFITSIKHVDPEQDLATIPNRPMITVIVKSQLRRRDDSLVTDRLQASALEVPFIGPESQAPIAPVTSEVSGTTKTFIAIPTIAPGESTSETEASKYVIDLTAAAVDSLRKMADSIGAACGPLNKRDISRRQTATGSCARRIVSAVQNPTPEAAEFLNNLQAGMEALGARIAPGTIFASPAWAGPALAAAGGASTVVLAWVGAYLFSGISLAAVSINRLGKDTPRCTSSAVAWCTDTCAQYPYASNYQVAYSSSCSESCRTFTACGATATKTTTTAKPTETYESNDTEDTEDPVTSSSDDFTEDQLDLDQSSIQNYCKLGLFDSVALPAPKCNDATGDKWVSSSAANGAFGQYCNNRDNLVGNKDASFLKWFNANSPDSLTFDIAYSESQNGFNFSTSTCRMALASVINGCSIPNNDNLDNHKFGGSIDHPCGGTFKFAPDPSPPTTCDMGRISKVPSNVFQGIYKGFCDQVGNNQGSALSWTTHADGVDIVSLKARHQPSATLGKRTPPPNPSIYKDYTFNWKYTPSTTRPQPKCAKSCKDAYDALTLSPCGHTGGEQSNMASGGKIQVGCGTYEYNIAEPILAPDGHSTLANSSCQINHDSGSVKFTRQLAVETIQAACKNKLSPQKNGCVQALTPDNIIGKDKDGSGLVFVKAAYNTSGPGCGGAPPFIGNDYVHADTFEKMCNWALLSAMDNCDQAITPMKYGGSTTLDCVKYTIYGYNQKDRLPKGQCPWAH